MQQRKEGGEKSFKNTLVIWGTVIAVAYTLFNPPKLEQYNSSNLKLSINIPVTPDVSANTRFASLSNKLDSLFSNNSEIVYPNLKTIGFDPKYEGATFSLPVDPAEPSVFGCQCPNAGASHNGGEANVGLGAVDICGDIGLPIHAISGGEVIYVGYFPAWHSGIYGLSVVIRHDVEYKGAKLSTMYNHLNSVDVEKGDIVKTGQIIAALGQTSSPGNYTGGVPLYPHLHVETRTVGAEFSPDICEFFINCIAYKNKFENPVAKEKRFSVWGLSSYQCFDKPVVTGKDGTGIRAIDDFIRDSKGNGVPLSGSIMPVDMAGK